MQRTGSAGPVRPSLWELLDGGGGDEYARVVRELHDVGWSGTFILDVLEAAPKSYANYLEGIRYREDAVRWCEAYYMLPGDQARLTSGSIMRANREHPTEVERLRAGGSWRRAELNSLRGELDSMRSAHLALAAT